MDIMTIISNAAGELIAPTTAAYVLAAIGLNIHFGMTGLMNMGQAGFMLLGAYGFAITQSMGCNLFASVCAALALAVIYALLLGIPTLKLGPDYLAMVTLAAAEIIRIVGRSTAMTNFTGGSAGISPQDFTEKFEAFSRCPTARPRSCCGRTATTSRIPGGCVSWLGFWLRSLRSCAGDGSTRRGAVCLRAFVRMRMRFVRLASRLRNTRWNR